jgi:hypothetical protein
VAAAVARRRRAAQAAAAVVVRAVPGLGPEQTELRTEAAVAVVVRMEMGAPEVQELSSSAILENDEIDPADDAWFDRLFQSVV